MRSSPKLFLVDIILINIVAIVGLRWISNAAKAGWSSIFFWISATLCFFIPQGIAVTRLSQHLPKEGGIYKWTQSVLGNWHGFLCGWCYWMDNLIYYPSLLVFTSTSALFLISKDAEENNKLMIIIISLLILWGITFLNIWGIEKSKYLSHLGTLGTWLPIAILFSLASIKVLHSGINIPAKEFIPQFKGIEDLQFFATLCFALAGFELAPIMGEEIDQISTSLPKAIIFSGIAIALIYITGTASLLLALPSTEISIITGPIQAISELSKNKFFLPFLAILGIVLGGIGGLNIWLGATARLPMVLGIDKYLPHYFAKLHKKWDTPYIALLFQSGVASFFLILSTLGSTLLEAYYYLLDMTIIIYFIPYLYMFASFLKLNIKQTGEKLLGFLGFVITLSAIVLSFSPPTQSTNITLYLWKLTGGCILFILPAWLIFKFYPLLYEKEVGKARKCR